MNLSHLRRRGELLEGIRRFFRERGFLEVDTPLVSREAIPERNIDLFRLSGDRGWLQASPEMHHKRLLCAGAGPLFEVTRSFRDGELGAMHRPEFTIVEWYRTGDDMGEGMALLDELMQSVARAPAAIQTSYREAFQRELGINPHNATESELAEKAQSIGTVRAEESSSVRDELLNALLALAVEPKLGEEAPEMLHDYPASQAALAKTRVDEHGDHVAERFELYWRGVELANGYHELTDPAELRRRLVEANKAREADKRPALPMPESLLSAMESRGLPDSVGVALGFDRLVMLAVGADHIDEVRAI